MIVQNSTFQKGINFNANFGIFLKHTHTFSSLEVNKYVPVFLAKENLHLVFHSFVFVFAHGLPGPPASSPCPFLCPVSSPMVPPHLQFSRQPLASCLPGQSNQVRELQPAFSANPLAAHACHFPGRVCVSVLTPPCFSLPFLSLLH